jgi:hypothetical protein
MTKVFYKSLIINVNFFSFCSILGLILTGHWFWLLSLVVSFSFVRDYRVLIGIISGSLCLWLLFYQTSSYTVSCQQQCVITHYGHIRIPGIPIVCQNCEPFHRYVAQNQPQFKMQHDWLPLVQLHCSDVFLQKEKLKTFNLSLRRLWEHSKPSVQAFYDCFIQGIYPKNRPWFRMVQAMGLLHLICFSGWHVNQLFNLLGRRPYVCFIVGCFLSWQLNFSFPFVRAFFMQLLCPFIPDRFSRLQLSLIGALIFFPFAWMTWSFWLTFYYAVLMEIKKIDEVELKFFGLGWAILFNQGLWPLFILLGLLIEPVIVYLLYPISWGSVFFEYYCPGVMDPFFDLMESFLMMIELDKKWFIQVPEWVGLVLLVMPFYLLLPTREYRLGFQKEERRMCG